MKVYTIDTYASAIEVIRRNERLWNVGQMHPRVLSQLYIDHANIHVAFDGWPLGGEGGIKTECFTLTNEGKTLWTAGEKSGNVSAP